MTNIGHIVRGTGWTIKAWRFHIYAGAFWLMAAMVGAAILGAIA